MQEHSLVPKSRIKLNSEVSDTKTESKLPKEKRTLKSFKLQPEVSADSVVAKKTNKNNIALMLANAEILMSHKEFSLAAGLVRQALQQDSFHVGALKKLIRCLNESQPGAKSLIAREKIYVALLKSEFCFENLAELGHVLYLQNRDEEAFHKYQEALSAVTETSSGLFEVYKNIGNILVREGNFDSAEEFYNKAFELDASSDTLLVNLGTLSIQQKDFEQGLVRFRRALEINAKNDKAWVGLAMVHNAMGDTVLAKANLENAIEAQPKNRTAVHMYANWCVRDVTYSSGIEVLQNYLSKVDSDEEMSLVLIHLLCLVNQNDLALLEAERVLLWNPAHTEIQKIEQTLRQSL